MDKGGLDFQPELVCRLKQALEKAGFTDGLIASLLEEGKLGLIREFLLGQKEICVPNYVIRLDRELTPPAGWVILRHQKMEGIIWDPNQVSFYQSEVQKNQGKIKGLKLLKESGLRGKRLLNAVFLEWCHRHPGLVPDKWAMTAGGGDRSIYFAGTVYRDNEAYERVRCLCKVDGAWTWRSRRLDEYWGPNEVIALLEVNLPAFSG